MKKILLVAVIILGIFFGGLLFSTYDYGYTCISCLKDYHIVEDKFAGITYRKNEKLTSEGFKEYEAVFGSPCVHTFKTGGFGRSFGGLWGDGIGCGSTDEGKLFRERKQILQTAMMLSYHFDDTELFKRTMVLVDEWFPKDMTFDYWEDVTNLERMTKVYEFEEKLRNVETLDQWRSAIDSVVNRSE
ncbi:MAG: hypothetical protein ACSHX4_08950 [Opitutaceae bacterium]